MSVPFGFSASDFVAGLNLLNKAIVALRDSDGANSQLQNTVFELESLVFTLQRVQGPDPGETASDTFPKLQFLGHQFYIHIGNFLSRITRLNPELGDQVTHKPKSFSRCMRRKQPDKSSGAYNPKSI
ncbi:hypothetical protein BKA63DRAFT_498853 [Paraphoma chrysanthemicola]|nr:hypothetical protein BKA63DRAFT_498853 [Paraphoma chrysanthemicola]